MSNVVEINDLEELAGYRLLWNALLPQTRGASFFHTLDWLLAYWRNFGEGNLLRVLVVYAAERPIGILPLCVRREHFRGARVLCYPRGDVDTFYGPIGPNPTATLLAGLGHVQATRRDWDRIDLGWVDADHVDHGRTKRAMQQVGFAAHKGICVAVPVVHLRSTWADYLARRTNEWREHRQVSERRLAEHGEFETIRYRPQGDGYGDGDPRWDLLEACEVIAYQGRRNTAAHSKMRPLRLAAPFFSETHALAARLGMLDMNLLLVNRTPLGFVYNFHCQGFVVEVQSRFLETCGAAVLYARMLRDSFQRGDIRYDFRTAPIATKRFLFTNVARSYRYWHTRSNVRGQILRAGRFAQAWWNGGRDAAAFAAHA